MSQDQMGTQHSKSVADPGFPVGGGLDLLGGCGPPMQALFGENVCENKRIGSRRGWCAPGMPPLDPPMQMTCTNQECYHTHQLLTMTIYGG